MRRSLARTVLFASCALACAPAAQASAASLIARGSAEQVYVSGAPAGARVVLDRRGGRQVAVTHADSLGGAVFRGVAPGPGYRVVTSSKRSGAVTVHSNASAPWDPAIYRQKLPASGYGYLTTRDGTKLALDIHLPGGSGPFPTLIEYAGYGYADPAGPDSGIAPIANLLGFAVVDVNMRGTGCSGGAFNYFEALQSLDGYDVIETVARQPWVLHHKVGMMGISYGGISQLFVAQTRPPDLAAITPLSVIDNSSTTLYPGGILNTGFTLPWAQERDHDALPASAHGGQPWALKRIQQGDRTCKSNQVLHGEAVSAARLALGNHYYLPSLDDQYSPLTFVNKITAPTFLACQLNDEQVGAHCPELVPRFTGTSRKWFTFANGLHIDSLDPATFLRWYDFLELFVARRAPHLSAFQRAAAPAVYSAAMGIPGVTLPADPIESEPSYGAALAAFEATPRVRILFDNGAGSAVPGAPYAAFEHSFARFPVPGTQARSWYLGANGTLSARAPAKAGSDSFTWTKGARPANDYSGSDGGGGLWAALPSYHWTQNPAGTAVAYVTAPLSSNTTVIGAGGVRLWVRASSSDVDLQVTVTEVRPDGKETLVQNGWLRASERKLSPSSTLLDPMPTYAQKDAAPLPKGRYTELTVPLFYEGHVYRKGSRIRIIISAPGGDQPVWAFARTVPAGKPKVSIARSASMPSRLILPVVPGLSVPTGLPPCPSLRGEPCRAYQPIVQG